MAWHYKAYQREQSAYDRQSYSQAEEGAKSGRVGLWKDEPPVPPWEFRRQKGTETNREKSPDWTTPAN
jgi:endonuclease YncB( thermonuclease family)